MLPLNTVQQALLRVLSGSSFDEALLKQFFSERYIQIVNGKSLDYAGFVAHIKLLKEVTQRLELTLISMAAAENDVHTHHTVRAIKNDGAESEFEVFAHFEVEDGKIVSCRELTHQIAGAVHDEDLGSRQ